MVRKSLIHCAAISLISMACSGFAAGQAAADDHKAQNYGDSALNSSRPLFGQN
jgi:hypothetical protein